VSSREIKNLDALVVHDITVGVEEAREALCAMRRGEVDALVVLRGEGLGVDVVSGADHAHQVLFDTLNEGAMTITSGATILCANARIVGLLAIPQRDVVGRVLTDFVFPDDVETFRAVLAQATAGSSKGEVRVVTADGRPVPVLLSISAVRPDPDLKYTVVMTDLTPLKEAQAELHRANQELEDRVADRTRKLSEANDALRAEIARRRGLETDLRRTAALLLEADHSKDEFLSMLAHELRNPLAPLVTVLELLRRVTPDNPRAQRYADVIARQVTNLTRLVDDLLEVSRIKHRAITLRKEDVDLASVVSAAVDAVRPAMAASAHELSVVLPEQPVHVRADSTRLEQVVVNLLNNASKYTPPGGHIGIEVERSGEEAIVRVRDDGVGIAAELLPRIFDLFVQADRSLDRAQGGLGIGLTLVKSLVEMHHGTVDVQSAGPGKGSVFTVRLPVLAARDAAVEARTASAARQVERDNDTVTRRVLIVEDNPDAAETLCELLTSWGCEVRAAANGTDAFGLAAAFEPNVVLIDIGLPGMDGYEVARRLRGRPRSAVPDEDASSPPLLIGLSGYSQETDRRRGLEAGFDYQLVKPADPGILRDLLKAG
jgi:PAS domain S-box-containing protein